MTDIKGDEAKLLLLKDKDQKLKELMASQEEEINQLQERMSHLINE